MKNFDTRSYNISDLIEWHETGLLDLSPKYQRRSVWTEKAKSYLIDTIIRGKPIPKILMTQSLLGGRNIRTVVDGQQRVRAILGFYSGDFKISRAHNKELAGSRYDDLADEAKNEFLKYEVGVDLLFDQRYEDILDIFARLNTYSVKLNPQELINSTYLGYFKQLTYACGYSYVGYWLESGVLTEKEVTRMAEAELASDLVACLISGIQAKKSIPGFYRKYEDDEDGLSGVQEKFDAVMAYIGAIYTANELGATNFKRIHIFYSLFAAIAHGLFGLPGMDDVPRPNLTIKSVGVVRTVLDDISAKFDQFVNIDPLDWDVDYFDFIQASRRGTTDLGARLLRSKFICTKIGSQI